MILLPGVLRNSLSFSICANNKDSEERGVQGRRMPNKSKPSNTSEKRKSFSRNFFIIIKTENK
jgi:hypothetical protein